MGPMDLNSSQINDSWDVSYDGMIAAPFGKDTYIIIRVVMAIAITGTFSLFGVIANMINLVVFYRQGPLSHSCTASLTGLSVSDFFFCAIMLWGSICLSIHVYVETSDFEWDVRVFYSYSALRPALMFNDVTSWLTAFIAFERLFSVTFPFKVKVIFTPKRSCVVIAGIFMAVFIYYIPNNFQKIPVWLEISNSTAKWTYVYNRFMPDGVVAAFIKSRVFTRTAVLAIVILSNVATTLKVNFSSKFRKSMMAAPPSSTTISPTIQDKNNVDKEEKQTNVSKKPKADNTNKELKLLRMMTFVCLLFIVCLSIDLVSNFIFYATGWERMVDYHVYTEYAVMNVSFFFQTINSSCNIVIYYAMSIRYREELLSICK